MRNINKPTVFTNNEIGKRLQKAWIQENLASISEEIEKQDKAVDMVLIIPQNGGRDAGCALENLQSYKAQMGLKSIQNDSITEYVSANKDDDNIIFIFLNLHGRISFYTLRLTMSRETKAKQFIN